MTRTHGDQCLIVAISPLIQTQSMDERPIDLAEQNKFGSKYVRTFLPASNYHNSIHMLNPAAMDTTEAPVNKNPPEHYALSFLTHANDVTRLPDSRCYRTPCFDIYPRRYAESKLFISLRKRKGHISACCETDFPCSL